MKLTSALTALALGLTTSLFAFDGTVMETMNSGGYTYVLLDQGDATIWVAGPEMSVELGQKMSTGDGMAMNNFHSRTLDRKFDTIYFVNTLSGTAGGHAATGMSAMSGMSGKDPHAGVPGYKGQPHGGGTLIPQGKPEAGTIKKAGYTIEEIYFQPAVLKGQDVEVRGVVTRFNGGIMGSNWIHIMDGTGQSGTDDLILTTQDQCAAGDQILITGRLVTDKDLGAGYFFPVLIENANIIVEKSAK
jgi:hypothetical protein